MQGIKNDDFHQAALESTRIADERAQNYPEHLRSFVRDQIQFGRMIAWTNRKVLNDEWRFTNYADLLLEQGSVGQYDLDETPIVQGVAQHCFSNALQLAELFYPEFTYVEGMASTGLLTVSHAWVVDPDGRVLDPTWQGRFADRGKATYVGIPFAYDFAVDVTERLLGRHELVGIIASDWALDTPALRYGFKLDSDGIAYAYDSPEPL